MPRLTALWMTPSAKDWMARARAARVLSAFERACNLVDEDGEVLALVSVERGLTPFSIMVAAGRFEALSTTDPVTVTGSRLAVGALTVDVSTAEVWDPAPDWAGVRAALARDPGRVAALSVLALDVGKPGSLLDLYTRAGLPTPSQAIVLDRARRGAEALCAGLRVRSMDLCAEGVRALAGLGGGLTPAGDDFLVGALLAAWAGLFGAGAELLAPPLVALAAPLTTALSAAYLRAAARGECLRLWHDLLAALTRAEAAWPAQARDPLQALLSIGHTSGADALAGFVAAGHFLPKEVLP